MLDLHGEKWIDVTQFILSIFFVKMVIFFTVKKIIFSFVEVTFKIS